MDVICAQRWVAEDVRLTCSAASALSVIPSEPASTDRAPIMRDASGAVGGRDGTAPMTAPAVTRILSWTARGQDGKMDIKYTADKACIHLSEHSGHNTGM